MIMSMSNGKYGDVLQGTTTSSLDSFSLTSFESNSTLVNNNHHQNLRLVQAVEQIEPQTSSKPFNFDIFRLMSILYSQSVSQSTEKTQGKISKPLKVSISIKLKFYLYMTCFFIAIDSNYQWFLAMC